MTDSSTDERIPLITGSSKGVSRNTVPPYSLSSTSSSFSSSSSSSSSSSTVTFRSSSSSSLARSPPWYYRCCCTRNTDSSFLLSLSPSSSYHNAVRLFLSLSWLPSSVIPPTTYPLSRIRHQLYEGFSSPWTSKLGIIVFWINALAILAYVVLFSVNSFEYYRRREIEGLYGTPELIFDIMDFFVIGVFTVTYVIRACCVTAIPDAIETRLFRAAASLHGVNWEIHHQQKINNTNLTTVTSTSPVDYDMEDDDIDNEDTIMGLLDLDGTKAIRKGARNSLIGLGNPTNEERLYNNIAQYYLVDTLGYPTIYNTSFPYYCGIRSSTSVYYSMHQPAPLRIVLWRALSRFIIWSFNFYNIIDVLTLIPYFIELWNEDIANNRAGEPLRVLRFLCLLRLLRLVSDTITLRLLRRAALQSMDSLWGSFFLMVILVVFLSAAIFLVEHGEYDTTTQEWMRPNIMGDGNEPSPFRSILHSIYWTVITMTTCGYGDMVPTSPVGRFLAICTIGLGLLVLALPATVVGLNFTIEYEKYRTRTLAKLEAQREKDRERIRQKNKEKERKNISSGTNVSEYIVKYNGNNNYNNDTNGSVTQTTIPSSSLVSSRKILSPDDIVSENAHYPRSSMNPVKTSIPSNSLPVVVSSSTAITTDRTNSTDSFVTNTTNVIASLPLMSISPNDGTLSSSPLPLNVIIEKEITKHTQKLMEELSTVKTLLIDLQKQLLLTNAVSGVVSKNS